LIGQCLLPLYDTGNGKSGENSDTGSICRPWHSFQSLLTPIRACIR
jgi:hypothetical protein